MESPSWEAQKAERLPKQLRQSEGSGQSSAKNPPTPSVYDERPRYQKGSASPPNHKVSQPDDGSDVKSRESKHPLSLPIELDCEKACYLFLLPRYRTRASETGVLVVTGT